MSAPMTKMLSEKKKERSKTDTDVNLHKTLISFCELELKMQNSVLSPERRY